jgi:hypothetical protein
VRKRTPQYEESRLASLSYAGAESKIRLQPASLLALTNSSYLQGTPWGTPNWPAANRESAASHRRQSAADRHYPDFALLRQHPLDNGSYRTGAIPRKINAGSIPSVQVHVAVTAGVSIRWMTAPGPIAGRPLFELLLTGHPLGSECRPSPGTAWQRPPRGLSASALDTTAGRSPSPQALRPSTHGSRRG